MKIGLDVDGVLADFYLSMCERFNQPYERVGEYEIGFFNDNIDLITTDKVFWDGLKVLNHPSMLTFDFDYYITAIPNHLAESRIAWLKNNGFPDKPVIVSFDKVSACRELGISVMIDDKPDTMLKFKEAEDLVGIQYIPPYSDMMVHGDYQVRCLTEIQDIIFQLKSELSH